MSLFYKVAQVGTWVSFALFTLLAALVVGTIISEIIYPISKCGVN